VNGPAQDAWDALVRECVRVPLLRRSRMRITDGPGRHAQVALWGFVHVLWAADDLRRVGGHAPLTQLTSMIGRYRRSEGFAATPRTRRRFFDDNAWLGLVALSLGDRALAARALAFVRTGEHPGGGIRWVEDGSSRNTCSTASAAWLAASLGDAELSNRLMAWVDATLRGADGLYADRIEGGRVDPTIFSYNQGAAAAALQAIGRGRDAVATARASLAVFDGERLWHEPPPFSAIWFRASLAIPSVADDARRRLSGFVDHLLADARDPATGLFTRGGLASYDGSTTIDQAAIVQLLTIGS
jgi:hypothetical protein